MGLLGDWYRGARAAGERQRAERAWKRIRDGKAREGDEYIVRKVMGTRPEPRGRK